MKLAILVRKDLDMRSGKIAVQVGHASVDAYRMANGTHEAELWYETGQKKIVLKVENLEMLESYERLAMSLCVQCIKVRDFGLTQVVPDTITCMAIGPDADETIDKITDGLKLL